MVRQPPGELRIVPLDSTHDRADFSCGVDGLDAYLKAQAGQDVRRKVNAVFVLVSTNSPTRVLGYFTLGATALTQGDVPDPARTYIPRYPLVSTTLIARLAVEKEQQAKASGGFCLPTPCVRRTRARTAWGRAWSSWMRSTNAPLASTSPMASCACRSRCV